MTPLIVSWGAGVNSTAMLLGMFHRQIRPNLILFADTGGEKPETYAYIDVMQGWLADVQFPPITVVKKTSMYTSLEDNCLRKEMLPSLAYGYKSCSEKWKHQPQEKYANNWWVAKTIWEAGGKVRKALGIDKGEQRRAKIDQDEKYTYWYPLIEWGWWREECVAAIEKERLPVPPKSACFYCPASTKREIFRLADKHPDLMARALAMEENAAENLDTTKGLGRRFAWGELLQRDRSLPLLKDLDTPTTDSPCMCFDGEE